MKKRSFLIAIALLLVVTLGTVLFIHYSNDHKECEETIVHTTDTNGNDVVVTEHHCKENFHL